MDWKRIKKASSDFDEILAKKISPNDACEDAQIMLAALMYSDAVWLVNQPKDERKTALGRVYAPFQDDVKEMAKMIIKGEI